MLHEFYFSNTVTGEVNESFQPIDVTSSMDDFIVGIKMNYSAVDRGGQEGNIVLLGRILSASV